MEKRNLKMDFFKGFAALIIVMGHVMQYAVQEFEQTIIFNIIWSIQIPLFMVISGYFGHSKKSFALNIKIKSIRYMIPFFSFFLISSLIENKNIVRNFRDLLFHLEISLWYLFVLFILSISNDVTTKVTSLITNKGENKLSTVLIHSVLFLLFLSPWVMIIRLKGTTFLGGKYVLYYSLFFLLGWLWRIFESRYNVKNDILLAIVTLVYCFIILTNNLYSIDDNLVGIIKRFISSIFGVIIIIRVLEIAYDKCAARLKTLLYYFGSISLEIYYVHMLFVHNISRLSYPAFSAETILLTTVLFHFVLIITILIVFLLKKNKILSFLLFGNNHVT